MIKARTVKGFTLAELLISLAILGEIAVFTIPKILSSQQNGQYNAVAKEAAAMLSGAYQQALLDGVVTSSTGVKDLTPYMNYVSIDTSTQIDDWQTGDDWGCSATIPCLVLHNGARVAYYQTGYFGGTSSSNSIYIQVDPNGRYSGTTNGPDKAMGFLLYYNGRLSTNEDYFGSNTYEPPWFHW